MGRNCYRIILGSIFLELKAHNFFMPNVNNNDEDTISTHSIVSRFVLLSY